MKKTALLDFLRGVVRPLVTLSGWLTILGLAVFLIIKFATEAMALALLGVLTGSALTYVSFWFEGRKSQPK